MKCIHCNGDVAPDALFCTACGGRILRETADPIQPQPAPPPYGGYQPPYFSPYNQPPPPPQAPARPGAVGQIVFAALAINFGMWLFFLGIIALVNAITSRNEPTYELALAKLNRARALSLVAVIVGPISFFASYFGCIACMVLLTI